VTGPEPVEIRLDRLLFPRAVPAGLDWAVLGIWTAYQRKRADPVDPPIVVRAEGDYFRITDGRHRVVGALLAGRDAIAALVEEPR
jgi:hypothetical protein